MSTHENGEGGTAASAEPVAAVPTAPIRLILGVALGALCATFLMASFAQGIGSLERIGGGAFPALAAGVGLLSAIAVIIEAAMRIGDAQLLVQKANRHSIGRMAQYIAGIVAFPLALRPLGFLIAAWITTAIVMFAGGQRSLPRSLGWSLIFATLLFFTFVEFLRVPLPRGPFLQ